MTKKIKAYVKNAKKEGYFNIMIVVDGFKCEVTPKFLTAKQKTLLYYKIEDLMDEDKDEVTSND